MAKTVEPGTRSAPRYSQDNAFGNDPKENQDDHDDNMGVSVEQRTTMVVILLGFEDSLTWEERSRGTLTSSYEPLVSLQRGLVYWVPRLMS